MKVRLTPAVVSLKSLRAKATLASRATKPWDHSPITFPTKAPTGTKSESNALHPSGAFWIGAKRWAKQNILQVDLLVYLKDGLKSDWLQQFLGIGPIKEARF